MELEIFKDIPDLPEEDEEVSPRSKRPYLEETRSMRKYPVPSYPMFIGRDRKATICVPIAAISRKHAKVFERNGEFFLQDLGSINGTFLNDKRIIDPVQLNDGDRVKVGVTRQFPRGARIFIFRKPEEEPEDILKEIGIASSQFETDRKKILLRNCVFKISKHNIMSLFRSESARRVELTKLDLQQKTLEFRTFIPFKIKEALIFSVEHPRLTETLRFTVRIINISEHSEFGVWEHETEIVKYTDKHQNIYKNMIKKSSLICYLTCTLKE